MRKIEQAIKKEIKSGTFPGLALFVAKVSETIVRYHAGFARLYPESQEMTPDTLFDLASLTKPVATTTAIMLLVQEGKLSLSDRAQDYLPGFGGQGKKDVTIRNLLTHSSGLPSWKPYYKEIEPLSLYHSGKGKSFIRNKVLQEELVYEPGRKAMYSDLGFILLGLIVEQITQQDLDSFCRQKIFQPLGLSHTFFINMENKEDLKSVSLARVAATEECPWRGKIIMGEVHDENAWVMGGVAGHSGLFSTAENLCTFAQSMLACYQGRGDLVSQKIAQLFFQRNIDVPGATWALGWDTPSPQGSSTGKYFSSQSIGHLGFTGTSLWIDLKQEIIVGVLTNRVHPRRANEKIRSFRPLLHNLIMEELMDNVNPKNVIGGTVWP